MDLQLGYETVNVWENTLEFTGHKLDCHGFRYWTAAEFLHVIANTPGEQAKRHGRRLLYDTMYEGGICSQCMF